MQLLRSAVFEILVYVVMAVMGILGAPFALRGGRLDAGIGTDRNEGLAALEAVTYVATALTIARLA